MTVTPSIFSVPPGSRRPPAVRRMAVFGIGYVTASLPCTFGVLLAVIAPIQAGVGYAGLLFVFTAYAAGSATVLLSASLERAPQYARGRGSVSHGWRAGARWPSRYSWSSPGGD